MMTIDYILGNLQKIALSKTFHLCNAKNQGKSWLMVALYNEKSALLIDRTNRYRRSSSFSVMDQNQQLCNL